MKTSTPLILSTSLLAQTAKKPRGTASLTRRQRPLYGRNQHYHTGKERDIETGLYYFGARYLDSRTGRWISGDPAVGDYVPSAPVDDEARKRNQNLPGMGGVFNAVNLHVYHYAGNNPVKYTDPDGESSETYARSRIFRMETAQRLARNAKMYVQGGGGRWALSGSNLTFCNQATFDTAEALGFNSFSLYAGENRDNVRANNAATNLAGAASIGMVVEVTGEQAQLLANSGYLVIAATNNPEGIGHLATVSPTNSPYNSSEGPLLSNVGLQNRLQSTAASFGQGTYEAGNVKFYFDFNQRFSFDPSVIAQPQN